MGMMVQQNVSENSSKCLLKLSTNNAKLLHTKTYMDTICYIQRQKWMYYIIYKDKDGYNMSLAPQYHPQWPRRYMWKYYVIYKDTYECNMLPPVDHWK